MDLGPWTCKLSVPCQFVSVLHPICHGNRTLGGVVTAGSLGGSPYVCFAGVCGLVVAGPVAYPHTLYFLVNDMMMNHFFFCFRKGAESLRAYVGDES